MYKDALLILNKLYISGFDSYIVGGYARDKYLGFESSDIDICTSAKSDDILRIFDDVKVNKKYGTSILTYNGCKYEITTFRQDHYTFDGSHQYPVSFVSTLDDDLKRRDFIMNTLCIDYNGNYIDKMNAIDDINNRIIRCVKDPFISFQEDPLRILRAIRFATTLSFYLSSDIQMAINKCSYLISNLSFDRIKKELDLIFSSNNVMSGIDLLRMFNLDKVLYLNLDNITYNSNYLAIWAQCLDTNKYNFSNKEKSMIKFFLKNE